jgi:hypothetical protein
MHFTVVSNILTYYLKSDGFTQNFIRILFPMFLQDFVSSREFSFTNQFNQT